MENLWQNSTILRILKSQGSSWNWDFFSFSKCLLSSLLSIIPNKCCNSSVQNLHRKISAGKVHWVFQAVESMAVSKCAFNILVFFSLNVEHCCLVLSASGWRLKHFGMGIVPLGRLLGTLCPLSSFIRLTVASWWAPPVHTWNWGYLWVRDYDLYHSCCLYFYEFESFVSKLLQLGGRLIELLTESAFVQPPLDQSVDGPPDIRPAFRHIMKTVTKNHRYGSSPLFILCYPITSSELFLIFFQLDENE